MDPLVDFVYFGSCPAFSNQSSSDSLAGSEIDFASLIIEVRTFVNSRQVLGLKVRLTPLMVTRRLNVRDHPDFGAVFGRQVKICSNLRQPLPNNSQGGTIINVVANECILM